MDTTIQCFSITVKGTVQGVGFRPFVYRMAKQHGIFGSVANTSAGVVVRAYGTKADLDNFIRGIRTLQPPLAAIASIDIKEQDGDDPPRDFVIADSSGGEGADIDIAADSSTCDACVTELFDPTNRRYRHPFINCTDCGPRYTIIKALPYDRPNTTMAKFPMCDACKGEYNDPADRRFHAQPVCCPGCGPRLTLMDGDGKLLTKEDPVADAVALLAAGRIVAIKGIGGFHLACRPDRGEVVAILRQRKQRDEKPFALMVKDVSFAQSLVWISDEERKLLETRERPIVVLRKRQEVSRIADNVAPGLTTLALMLPYAPLHYLLFHGAPFVALVMTSANVSDRPITFENEAAMHSLRTIADTFLMHDRDIHVQNDDSIVRVIAGAPVILRRSRGFAPEPLPCPREVDSLVALGGVLKSTVAVGRKMNCYCSHYLGSIETVEDVSALQTAVVHLSKALDVVPSAYVCDSHPQSLVSSFARSTGAPVSFVQHHHAHAAACMAENEISRRSLCIVYDGTGYGDDGKIWGSEILDADYSGFERLGHMTYLALPGGDEAIRYPGRIALAALHPLLGDKVLDAFPLMPEAEKNAVLDMVKSNTNCVLSCGMGRLFDAVSALLGICTKRTYEGQPAIMLEGVADGEEKTSYGSPLSVDESGIVLDAQALLAEIFEDLSAKAAAATIAARFHNTLAQATAAAAAVAAGQCDSQTVCLSGGVFQNALLVERLVPLLKQAGLTPVLHRRTPPNDECISYGQLVIAGARKLFQPTETIA